MSVYFFHNKSSTKIESNTLILKLSFPISITKLKSVFCENCNNFCIDKSPAPPISGKKIAAFPLGCSGQKNKPRLLTGLVIMANDSNFDRNLLRGCNYGLEGGAFLILGGCIFDVRGCSLMHNIKELQISIFSASNAIIFPFWCPTLCWNQRTLSVQFRFQYLSASSSYSGWYAQGLPRSP